MTLPQGDLGLLDSPIAQRLLTSTELARIAYLAKDGTPRVVPMLFHWTGDELVLPTFANSSKVRSLRANPEIAVTIDSFGPPPDVLLLRGRVTMTEVAGVLPEYGAAQRRYYGEEHGAAGTAAAEATGVNMVRIALRPTWVGALDFQTRLPAAMAS